MTMIREQWCLDLSRAENGVAVYIVLPDGEPIMSVWTTEPDHLVTATPASVARGEARARLACAAPRLFDALAALEDWACENHAPSALIDEAQAALDEAGGGERITGTS